MGSIKPLFDAMKSFEGSLISLSNLNSGFYEISLYIISIFKNISCPLPLFSSFSL